MARHLTNQVSLANFNAAKGNLPLPQVCIFSSLGKTYVSYRSAAAQQYSVHESGKKELFDTSFVAYVTLSGLADSYEDSQVVNMSQFTTTNCEGIAYSVEPINGSYGTYEGTLVGAILTLSGHYDGQLKIKAYASWDDEIKDEKIINVHCDDVASTSYSVSNIVVNGGEQAEANDMAATVTFKSTVTTTYSSGKTSTSATTDEQQVVTFDANTSESVVTREGSFQFNGQTVNWSLEQKAAEAQGGGDGNEHPYVDLGLSVKWAKMNVGATSEEEYGNYFQWGSVTPNDNDSCSDGTQPFGSNPPASLDAEHDAATVLMGGSWRMPTNAEFEELLAKTNVTWDDGGCKFTSQSDAAKYIFIPAAGYRCDGSFSSQGSRGCVWSNKLYSSNPAGAWSLNFYSYYQFVSSDYCCYGRSVRGVF